MDPPITLNHFTSQTKTVKDNAYRYLSSPVSNIRQSLESCDLSTPKFQSEKNLQSLVGSLKE